MSSSLEKLRALTSKLEEKLEQKESRPKEKVVETEPAMPVKETVTAPTSPKSIKPTAQPAAKVSFETVRQENIDRVKTLFENLKIFEKSPDFDHIFDYKAMNLSGIGLKEEDWSSQRRQVYSGDCHYL